MSNFTIFISSNFLLFKLWKFVQQRSSLEFICFSICKFSQTLTFVRKQYVSLSHSVKKLIIKSFKKFPQHLRLNALWCFNIYIYIYIYIIYIYIYDYLSMLWFIVNALSRIYLSTLRQSHLEFDCVSFSLFFSNSIDIS